MLLPAEPAIFHRKPFLLDRTVKQILVIQIRRHLVDSFSKMNEVSLSLQDKQMKHLWPMIKLKQRSRKCLFITVSLEDSRYIPKTFQKSISVDIKDTVWHEKKKSTCHKINWIYIKIKNFCISKDTINKSENATYRIGRKYLQIMYLIRC